MPHIGHAEQYGQVVTEKYTLSSGNGDNCVQIVNDIAIVQNIVKAAGGTFVIFQRFCHKESYFQYPLPSSYIGCYRVWELNNSLGVAKLQHINKKYVLFPDKTAFIAMPIIHS